MVRGAVYPQYRRGGRFFGRRVNCEYVPLLPAGAVRRVLDDPRKIPYLLVWKNSSDGEVKDAVRVALCEDPGPFYGTNREVFCIRGRYLPCNWVNVKRTDRSNEILRTVWQPLPRNRARDLRLVCPGCQAPRRFLYGWEPGGQYTSSVQTSRWQCRKCAELRYASEGGALLIRGGMLSRLLGRHFPSVSSPRPDPWYPHVFSSLDDAAAAGFCNP
jgi:hypothetical protein